MSTKTTIALLFLLGASVFALYAVRTRPASESVVATPKPPPMSTAGGVARELVGDKPTDVNKIVYSRPNQTEWVFEKRGVDGEAGTAGDTATATDWWLTSPMETKVAGFEVDRIVRTLSDLKYEVSYAPGAPGAVSAKDAGLEPPQAVVTLTGGDGKTVAIEIGGPASEESNYVRLAGFPTIAASTSNLRSLFKPKAIDYRDKQLWTFEPSTAKRLEIVDRTDSANPATYVFVADGASWRMESPSAAKATDKVTQAVTELGRLRATQWMDDAKDRLAVFGFDAPAMTITVSTEKKIEVPKPKPEGETPEAAEGEAPAAEIETKIESKTHVLHVSARSPIGEETKVYIRSGDDTTVGTMLKTTVDKLRPVLKDWRDMHVSPLDAASATRVDVATPEGAFALVKKDGAWTLDGGGAADEEAVSGLLAALGKLTAVNFVDAGSPESASAGFDKPQADLRIAAPGVDGVERITVGGFTDPASRRIVSVRRNESASIARVLASDVAMLTRGLGAYRDRRVVSMPIASILDVSLSRAGGLGGGRVDLTMARSGGAWTMTAPVESAVRADRAQALVDKLTNLRAESVVSDGKDASAYGLMEPDARVTVRYATNADGEAVDAPNETEPAATKEIVIAASAHDGKHYGARSDRPAVYAISADVFAALTAEVRADETFAFDAPRVASFSVRDGDQTTTFERRDKRWVLPNEPDFPLDAKKVEDLLLRVRDLRSERYVSHERSDGAPGLDRPRHEVRVTLDDGAEQVMKISGEAPRDAGPSGYFATISNHPGVFLVSETTIHRFAVVVDQLR